MIQSEGYDRQIQRIRLTPAPVSSVLSGKRGTGTSGIRRALRSAAPIAKRDRP